MTWLHQFTATWRIRLHRASRFGVMVGTLVLGSAGHAVPFVPVPVPVPDLASCNAADFQEVLMPAHPAARLDARAYWLSRNMVQWPGMPTDQLYKLYFAVSGQGIAMTGQAPTGFDGALILKTSGASLDAAIAQRFKFVADGVRLTIRAEDASRMPELHRMQLVLVQQDPQGVVLAATRLQAPGALDDLYATAQDVPDLGAHSTTKASTFKLWAPTAQAVSVCTFGSGRGAAQSVDAMRLDATSGIWSHRSARNLSGRYYRYLVDVVLPGGGLVRNRVTDPYSLSLNTNSQRSYIADLNNVQLQPPGWASTPRSDRVKAQTDMVVYELHVRDFSINDATVAPAHRGKYTAFAQSQSNGMRHLLSLSRAGMTDVHLLPVFDIGTIPEDGCVTPVVTAAAPDSEAQQAAVMAVAGKDCFNWGYDPFHFNAPEGSFSTDADDGARRILEFRQMVLALHRIGLRVGMDVVYNHTTASGQSDKSVLDRIVPGYYQRLNARGEVERSTCCDNTATEHQMMGKLMVDSAEIWARDYKIDSFRFDLMAHQPRAVMEDLQKRVNAAAGRHINLIGEGWNFGEVADGARFVQASQLSLNGSGIGTFSDRGRDAVRGGRAGDGGEALVKNQGYINGLVVDPNAMAPKDTPVTALMQSADMVRVGLAGSVRDYAFTNYLGVTQKLSDMDYSGQSAGYVSQPGEVVNYVENHDNQTLYDINAYKLPAGTSSQDRARVQMLGGAINAFSQGVAYFHAGMETLRSKSMDGNSYDSGDWFNRLDWTFTDNYFGTGAPPKSDNAANYALIKPLLANPQIKPTPADIRWTRDQFNDLLKIRASSTLFRMRTAQDIAQRLTFHNTGSAQNPAVLVGHLRGKGYAGARFQEVLYLVNVAPSAQEITVEALKGQPFVLHPVHRATSAADSRPLQQGRFDPATGRFTVPARTAVVYVLE